MNERRIIRGDADMTPNEIDAETYLELGDDCLAGLVRGLAADYSESLASSEDEFDTIIVASGLLHLILFALRVNADKVTKELDGVTYKGEDIGDWRVTLERIRDPDDSP